MYLPLLVARNFPAGLSSLALWIECVHKQHRSNEQSHDTRSEMHSHTYKAELLASWREAHQVIMIVFYYRHVAQILAGIDYADVLVVASEKVASLPWELYDLQIQHVVETTKQFCMERTNESKHFGSLADPNPASISRKLVTCFAAAPYFLAKSFCLFTVLTDTCNRRRKHPVATTSSQNQESQKSS